MKILITAVGQRTEHWTDLFALLARRPGMDLTIAVADVSPLTLRALESSARQDSLRYVHLPHILSEGRTGHMASIVIRPGALRAIDTAGLDAIHIIGEPAYLSTAQIISWRNRRMPHVAISHYAAQNVVTRFPIPFPWLERRAYKVLNHAFPITPAALQVLRVKGYRGPATIVPLGVDTTLFAAPTTASPRGRFTLGFVGRLEPHKGVGELVSAAQRLDCDLLVVGSGSLSELVRAAARTRPGRVRLHDWVDHEALPGLLRQMDVLVLPSSAVVQRNVLPWVGIPLREQFGRVLVEAMACGIPVVGSDVGEIPHVIAGAGLVYPAGDVSALIDRLTRLRDEPGLAQLLTRNGTERAASQFGWDGVAESMHQVWQSVGMTDEPSSKSRPIASAEKSDAEKSNEEKVA